jgi:hypothetical protein
VGHVGQAELGIALEVDHVLVAVGDLAAADRDLSARYALSSIEGGRHPGWGTANRIVPLGETYLELVAVVDEAEAGSSAFGRWVAAGAGPLGWAVRTRDVEGNAERLGLRVTPGSRRAPSGELLAWWTAGIEEAAADPSLPFFIQWEEQTPFPGRMASTHPAGAVTLTRLVLTGDPDRLTAWLGDHRLPIIVRPGSPALERIVLAGATGEIELDGTRP